MRPRELTLVGFRSYRERTTFDFRGRRLLGIVGPIGAGKSSILDGVAFALFGKTPAIERDTRSLIHQLDDVAHVELIFEVDGQIWRAQRGLRRKGKSGHKLERLTADVPEALVEETVEGERETRDRVQRLLGMDFDAFCRSVLLAQNRFAEFLKARDGERNDVLKGVFGYERFDAAYQAARSRVALGEATVEALETQGTELARARAELDPARAAVAAATQRSEAFAAARPEVERLLGVVDASGRAVEDADRQVALLEQAAARLPGAEGLLATIETVERADDAISAAAAAAEVAEVEADRARADRDARSATIGDVRAFTELVARHDELARALVLGAEKLDGAREAREAATLAVAKAGTAVGEGASAVAHATEERGAATALRDERAGALHQARHAEMAIALRGGLEVGAPCPVCAQEVTTLPPKGRAPATRKAERELETAERALERATRAIQEAESARARAEEGRERLASALEAAEVAVDGAEREWLEAEAALAATKSELVDRLGEGDPRLLLDEREREIHEAEERLRAAEKEASAARQALEDERRGRIEAADALAKLATRLASAWGLLGEERADEVDPGAIRASYAAFGETVLARHAAVAAARDEARADATAATTDLEAQLVGLGLEPDADFTAALAEANAARGAAEQRVRDLEATIEAGGDLSERLAAAAESLGWARRLKIDLQPSGFLAWALGEERQQLAELGSAHLEDLTDGAYRFADDGTFRVADQHAGDAVRASDSLSGGETFLASLALALALAEMVTRGGGRLDAFFLDEGFGSLDPEHLERALDGIGRLVAEDPHRLVVLVSHVEYMQLLLEDLIVLGKDERTGDSRVLSGASPAMTAGPRAPAPTAPGPTTPAPAPSPGG